MRVHVGVQGGATAAVAWERYADPDAWSGWSPQIRRVETAAEIEHTVEHDTEHERERETDPETETETERGTEHEHETEAWPPRPAPRRIAAGLRGVVVGPVGVQVPFEVLDVDEEAMSWTWRVHALLAELTLEHSVAPRVAGGCRTDLVVVGPAPLVLGYAPIARLALTRLVRP